MASASTRSQCCRREVTPCPPRLGRGRLERPDPQMRRYHGAELPLRGRRRRRELDQMPPVGNHPELRLMHGSFSRPYSICGPAARQASWTSGFKAKKAIVSVFVWCAWIKIVRGYRESAIGTLIACDGSLPSRPQPTTSSTCSSSSPRRHECAQRVAKCDLTIDRSPNDQ